MTQIWNQLWEENARKEEKGRLIITNFLGRCPLRQLQLFPSIFIPSRSLTIPATRRMAGNTFGLHWKYSNDSLEYSLISHQVSTITYYLNLNCEYISLNREYVMAIWIRYSQYPVLLLLDPQCVYLFIYVFIYQFLYSYADHLYKNIFQRIYVRHKNHDIHEIIIKWEFLSRIGCCSYIVANVVDSIY